MPDIDDKDKLLTMGQILEAVSEAIEDGFSRHLKKCPWCMGSGEDDGALCRVCDGSGHAQIDKPPGTD